MLKASVNITHDLAHAFDGCADGPAPGGGGACPAEPICLVLKRWWVGFASPALTPMDCLLK